MDSFPSGRERKLTYRFDIGGEVPVRSRLVRLVYRQEMDTPIAKQPSFWQNDPTSADLLPGREIQNGWRYRDCNHHDRGVCDLYRLGKNSYRAHDTAEHARRTAFLP
jgi:hypothetical protein